MRRLVLLMVLLLSAGALSAQELTGNFEIARHVAVRLPAGWRKVSAVQLRMLNAMAHAAGMKLDLDSQIVFQSDGRNAFEFPYLTAVYRKTGRLAVRDVDELLDKIKANIDGIDTKQVEKDTANMVRQPIINDYYYDEQTNTVGMVMHARTADGTGVSALIVIYFVKGGYLQLNFYSADRDFAYVRPLFETIAEGVTIDRGYSYNPIGASKLLTFFLNLDAKTQSCLILGLLGLIGKLASLAMRRAAELHAGRESRLLAANEFRSAAVPPTEEQYRAAPRDEALIAELIEAAQGCTGIQGAELYAQSGGSSAGIPAAGSSGKLVLVLELQQDLSLKKGQEALQLLRSRISRRKVAEIICRRAPGMISSGLPILTQPDRAAAKPAAAEPAAQRPVPVVEDDGPLELDL